MIAPEAVEEVRRLLAEGKLSQRAIARITRVSRGTVGAIATGKRPDRQNSPRARTTEELSPPAGPLQRCPGCGGMVYMPCRACQIRTWAAHASMSVGPPWPGEPDEPLQLDLNRQHRARYEEVRLQRSFSAESASAPADRDEPCFPDLDRE